jgi:hypothetical protein
MPTLHTQASLAGGVSYEDTGIGANASKVRVEVISTVGDDQVNVSFNGGDSVADILGPFDEREMIAEYESPSSHRISFQCDSAAEIRVTYIP